MATPSGSSGASERKLTRMFIIFVNAMKRTSISL